MIIDSSALVAIALEESDADAMQTAILTAEHKAISAATLVEASIVIDRRTNPNAIRRFDRVIGDAAIEIVPFTQAQALIARQAYRDFGRGSGHPANLNYGDCFSYALAIERDEPLLYAGEGFVPTDVESAL